MHTHIWDCGYLTHSHYDCAPFVFASRNSSSLVDKKVRNQGWQVPLNLAMFPADRLFIYFIFIYFFTLFFPPYMFFLPYSVVTQLHRHVHALFSHMVLLHPKWLDLVPRAAQQDLNSEFQWQLYSEGWRWVGKEQREAQSGPCFFKKLGEEWKGTRIKTHVRQLRK